MNNKFKVAIVGGGASGLFTAIELLQNDNSLRGEDIVILEKNDRVGKKILVTGNGQANISNMSLSYSHYHGDKGFIRKFFDNDISLLDYFYKLGIPYTSDPYGRVYPLSYSANSFLDNIRGFLTNKKANIYTNFNVEKIKYTDCFTLYSSCGEVKADYCVMAVGGKSGKQFGTDGSSYKLLESFKHRITDLYPSLVQLKTNNENIKGLKGIKEKVNIKAVYDDKIVGESKGDLIFTDYGISGDAVFKISSSITQFDKPIIIIEFLPGLSNSELKFVIADRDKIDYIDNAELLTGIINKKFAQCILKCCKTKAIDEIVYTLKNFTLTVLGTAGFDQSQVTKGGVMTDDVNPITMRSKLQKDLYVLGEVLNVDGDCGGYNLSFAFLSGIKCAVDIKKRIKGE